MIMYNQLRFWTTKPSIALVTLSKFVGRNTTHNKRQREGSRDVKHDTDLRRRSLCFLLQSLHPQTFPCFAPTKKRWN